MASKRDVLAVAHCIAADLYQAFSLANDFGVRLVIDEGVASCILTYDKTDDLTSSRELELVRAISWFEGGFGVYHCLYDGISKACFIRHFAKDHGLEFRELKNA